MFCLQEMAKSPRESSILPSKTNKNNNGVKYSGAFASYSGKKN